jgi:transposase
MWTTENRARYDRSRLRYPSDLTDDEWAWIRPLIPPARPGGNKRTVVERDLKGASQPRNVCHFVRV